MEKIKQIHLQMHLNLGNEKPKSAEVYIETRVSWLLKDLKSRS